MKGKSNRIMAANSIELYRYLLSLREASNPVSSELEDV